MKVTRLQVIARGLTNRCPNCGGRTLFEEGSPFRLRPACPACGLRFERDEGFFLGSMSLNYGVTIVVYLLPVGLLGYHKVLTPAWTVGLLIAGALLFPIAFYRSSRSWWLMNYYLFLPHHLPANKGAVKDEAGFGDENL